MKVAKLAGHGGATVVAIFGLGGGQSAAVGPDSACIEARASEALEHFVQMPASRRPAALQTRFDQLAAEWKQSTLALSSMSKIYSHPACREIVAMGRPALSLIFKQLATSEWFWFGPLMEITGENPVLPEHEGRIALMREDWLNWWSRRATK